MAENGENQLRAMIRLIPPARNLKDQLEKSIHLEIYEGTGDFAVQSFRGLLASVARIADDPYVNALDVSVPEGAGDREKVSMALLAAGQLQSYLEGQTGLAASGGGGGNNAINIQRGVIQLNDVAGLPPDSFARLFETADREAKGNHED
jgi:hypothetical protein